MAEKGLRQHDFYLKYLRKIILKTGSMSRI